MWGRFVYGVSKVGALLFSLVYFRIGRHGRELVPREGPVVLVANHASHLDPMLVGVACPRPVQFMARRTLAKVPLLGWWMRTIGVILLNRQGMVKESMVRGIESLAKGRVICLFPEGTRTRTGEVMEFHRGALLLLKKSGAAVVPVGVRGSFSAFPRGKTLPRPRRCSVHFGVPVPAAQVLADGGLQDLRRQIAELAGVSLGEST